MMDPSDVKEYAEDGCYVHGLYLEGGRWDEGALTDSKLKELLSSMPVIYVKSVPIQPHWEPSPVGYLRHDPNIYECPVYMTSFRGPTYIFLATLRSEEDVKKWVMRGTAMLLQTDN
jgi:dynein heavy chain